MIKKIISILLCVTFTLTMFSVSVSAEETEEYDVFLLPVISEKMLEDQRYDQIQVYWDKNSNIPFVSIDQATSIVGGSCNYKTGWYTVDKDYFHFRYNNQDDMKLYLGDSDYGILLLDGNLFESRLIHGRWYVDFWGFCYMFDEKFEKIDSNISAKDGFNTDDIAKYKLFMEKNYFPFFLYISDGYNLSSAYEDIMQYKGNYVWNYSKYPESETWFKNIMGSSEANIKTFSYNYLSNVVCDWGNTVSAAVVPYKPDEHYTEALINITNINYLKYLVEYNKYDNNYYSLTKGDSLYTALNSYNVAEDFINNKIPEDLQKALKGFTIFLDTYQTVAQTIRMYKYLDSIDSRRIQLLQDSIINNTNLSSMAENDQKTRKWIEKLSVYSTGATSVSHEKFKEFIDDFNLPFNPAKYHIRNPYLTILNYSLNNSASLKDSAEKLTDSYRNQTKQVFDTLENGYESIVSSVGNEVLINILESSPKTKPVALVIGLIDKLMSASKVEFGETLKKSELLYQCEYIEQVLLQGLDERDKHNLRSRLSMLLRASLFCHLLVPDSSTKDIKDICSLLYDIDYDSDNLRYYNDPRNPQPFNDIKELIVDYKTERVNKGTISGKVLTEDKNPIKNAKIEVYTSSGNQAIRFGDDECYTDGNGEFSISMPEGKYLVVVTHDGYDPVNVEPVAVEKQKTNRVDNIYMKASNTGTTDYSDLTIEIKKLTNADIKPEWTYIKSLNYEYPIFKTSNQKLKNFLEQNITEKMVNSVGKEHYESVDHSIKYSFPVESYLNIRIDQTTHSEGMPHPIHVSGTCLVDLKNCKMINFYNLFNNDEKEIKKEIVSKANKYLDSKYSDYYVNIGEYAISENRAFEVSENTLKLIFSPYEVASYSTGYVEVEIPWSDINLNCTLRGISTESSSDNDISDYIGTFIDETKTKTVEIAKVSNTEYKLDVRLSNSTGTRVSINKYKGNVTSNPFIFDAT